jgi:hypothetical protein
MKKFFIAVVLVLAFSTQSFSKSCEEYDNEFIEKTGNSALKLKIGNWLTLKDEAQKIFPGEPDAPKCILRNNSKAPANEKKSI